MNTNILVHLLTAAKEDRQKTQRSSKWIFNIGYNSLSLHTRITKLLFLLEIFRSFLYIPCFAYVLVPEPRFQFRFRFLAYEICGSGSGSGSSGSGTVATLVCILFHTLVPVFTVRRAAAIGRAHGHEHKDGVVLGFFPRSHGAGISWSSGRNLAGVHFDGTRRSFHRRACLWGYFLILYLF